MTRLDDIRKRCDVATAGPWEWSSNEQRDAIVSRAGMMVATWYEEEGCDLTMSDADFIAHSRTDVPWLLDRVEELAEMVRRLKAGYGSAHEIEANAALAKLEE